MTQSKIQSEAALILLVEDNDDHAELIIRGLQETGVANGIHRVPDGETALDYLFQRGEYADAESNPRPDLVLLDLRLPKIDGIEVLDEIKADEELRRIPVVVLTTSQSDIDISKATDHHANSYLVKPLDFHELQRLMRDLSFYWLIWNQQSYGRSPHRKPGWCTITNRPHRPRDSDERRSG